MRRSRLIPITALLLLLFAAPPVGAQGNGKMTPYEITVHALDDTSSQGRATVNMKGRVWVSTLVGEPVVACNAEWAFWKGVGGEPVISINGKQISNIPRKVLDKITLHNVKLGFVTKPLDARMFARNIRYEIACDPGAMEKPGGKASFTVPGSYSWNELFYVRDSFDGEDKSTVKYAAEKTAKQIMIHLLENGFATESGSAKILTASLNLGAIVDWLEEKEKLAEEKGKEKKNAAAGNTKDKGKDDFWSGGGRKKAMAKSAETKKKSADDRFWSGKKIATNSQSGEKSAKADSGGFWDGNTSAERKKHQADINRKQDLQRKKLAAAANLKVYRAGYRSYGYKTAEGKIVITPQFHRAGRFSEGRAVVEPKDDLYGIIDTKGNWILKARPGRIDGPYRNGLVKAAAGRGRNLRYGYLDRSGQWAIQPQFVYASSFSGGLAVVRQRDRGLYGYIDKKGNWVLQPRYDGATGFSDQRALVTIGKEQVIIDPTGKEVYRTRSKLGRASGPGGTVFYLERNHRRTGQCDSLVVSHESATLDKNGRQIGAWKKQVTQRGEFCLQAR